MVGGYSAYRVARSLWYWSLNLSSDHALFYDLTSCKLTYKVGIHHIGDFRKLAMFILPLKIFR